LSELKREKKKTHQSYEEAMNALSEERLASKRYVIQLEEYEKKVNRLEEAKHLMQKTLLDQLNKERERAKQYESDMKLLRTDMKNMESDNSRMQILLRAQKRSKENTALKSAQRVKERIEAEETIHKDTDQHTSISPMSSPTVESPLHYQPTPPKSSVHYQTPDSHIRSGSIERNKMDNGNASHLSVQSSLYSPTLSINSPIESHQMGIINSGSRQYSNSVTNQYGIHQQYTSSGTVTGNTSHSSSNQQFYSPPVITPPLQRQTNISSSNATRYTGGVNTATKRIPDKYTSNDGQPLDIFTLAYSNPNTPQDFQEATYDGSSPASYPPPIYSIYQQHHSSSSNTPNNYNQ
jgi:hypothetical protein